MRIFRKKSKEKTSQSRSAYPLRDGSEGLKENSNRAQRSKIGEKILRDGPDKGFVWYDEA